MRWDGELLDVDELLAGVPPLDEKPGTRERAEKAASDNFMVQRLVELGMVKRDGKLSIICPFESQHSEPGGESSSVYLLPHFNGVKTGRFHCLHAHCKGRTQSEFLAAIGVTGNASPAPEMTDADWEAHFEQGAGEDQDEARASHGAGWDPPTYEWPAPEPLPTGLPPVAAFDYELLPAALRPWIKDIAERMQCPPDFPAVGTIVCLSAIVGRQLGIRPKRYDDWTVVPNLWGGSVGRPGFMKTPALTEPMKILSRFEIQSKEEHEADLVDFKARQIVSEEMGKVSRQKIAKALKLGSDPKGLAELLAQDGPGEEPRRRRYTTNNCTIEKLGELLRDNPRGILVFRDELVGLLASLDQEGREAFGLDKRGDDDDAPKPATPGLDWRALFDRAGIVAPADGGIG